MQFTTLLVCAVGLLANNVIAQDATSSGAAATPQESSAVVSVASSSLSGTQDSSSAMTTLMPSVTPSTSASTTTTSTGPAYIDIPGPFDLAGYGSAIKSGYASISAANSATTVAVLYVSVNALPVTVTYGAGAFVATAQTVSAGVTGAAIVSCLPSSTSVVTCGITASGSASGSSSVTSSTVYETYSTGAPVFRANVTANAAKLDAKTDVITIPTQSKAAAGGRVSAIGSTTENVITIFLTLTAIITTGFAFGL